MNTLVVNNIKDLTSITDIEINVPVYVEDNGRFYAKNEAGQWEPVKFNAGNSNIQMSLYDMNKQIIKQLGDLSEEQIEAVLDIFEKYHSIAKQEYYLLYGKEISYFTLFHCDEFGEGSHGGLGELVIECLTNIGPIYSISLTEAKDAIELWVLPDGKEDVTCLYLFGYDQGVVEFG